MASKNSSVGKYFLRFWGANFIFWQAAVPLLFLTIYLILLANFLPEGVNQKFAEELWLPTLGLSLAFLFYVASLTFAMGLFFPRSTSVLGNLYRNALLSLSKRQKIIFKGSGRKIVWSDLILLLLPLTPVVQYILNNQDILSLWDSLLVLSAGLLISGIFILGIPFLIGKVGDSQTLKLLSVSLVFTLFNMASLSNQFAWFEMGSLKIQLLVFGGVFLVSWFLVDLNQQKLLYLLVAVYFLSNSFMQLLNPGENYSAKSKQNFAGNELVSLVGENKPARTPNIYLLLYDAYAHNETILSYGIDNNLQEEYLASQGFKLYPSTYSVGAASIDTMSRVLNASSQYYGLSRRAVSGDGVVQSLLNSFGYKTYGVFPSEYFFRGVGQNYDFSFPKGVKTVENASPTLLVNAFLTGEFKFDLEFDEEQTESFLSKKRSILMSNFEDPVFLYSHSKLPGHSQNSGKCLPDENQLFKERLDKGNLEMRQDLDVLIKNDPEAIVIVAGDHGPYLTKNCTITGDHYELPEISRQDIQDRFGTFLAIRWPDKGFEEYDDITVLQDLFPAIFSYLFGNSSFLQAKNSPVILETERVSGASVENGIIRGGVDDGEPLFLNAR